MAPPPRLAMSASSGRPVVPRPSASVLVVDPGPRPWRVLMMQRPGGADFAPGAWVFPGGSLSEEDGGQPDASRAAALRELFEEVGLLLSHDPVAEADRHRLGAAPDGGFWSTLSGLGLRPAFDDLVFLTRWITPEAVPRRFDTRFYLAPRPADQDVVASAGEVTDWRWVAPAEAATDPALELVYATRRILELVAGERDPKRLLERLRGRPETPPVTPRVVRRDDGGFDVLDDAPPLPII